MSLSSTNIRILENCIYRALFKIFGSCDKSSLDYIKICTGLRLDNIKGFLKKRHCSFIDNLISDVRFSNLLLVYGFIALYRLQFYVCVLFVCVCVSICVFILSGCIYCEINYIYIYISKTTNGRDF